MRRWTASRRTLAVDLTRRRLLQWGVAGSAAIYGAKQLGFEQVWESVAAAAEDARRDKCLVLLYLAGGNDGLNVRPPQRQRADYPRTRPRGPRSTARRAHADGADRVGSTALPGAGGGALAFSNVAVSKAAVATTGARFNFTGTVATTSASTRSTATAPAAPAPTSR